MKLFALLVVTVSLLGCRASSPNERLAEAGRSRVAPPTSQPSAPAESVYRRPLPQAISEGVTFLVKSQTPDGSWGTGTVTRGTEVYSMVPGSHDAYRVAVTSL